jgi:ATP/ADP translocase
MKKASMILGIIGGIIAIIIALCVIGGGIFLRNVPELMENSHNVRIVQRAADAAMRYNFAGAFMIITGVVIALAGVVGIVGGSMVRGRSTAGGIMMLTAGFVSLITGFAVISFVLFLIGGIFAFIKDDAY